jgi:hypothetical protein
MSEHTEPQHVSINTVELLKSIFEDDTFEYATITEDGVRRFHFETTESVADALVNDEILRHQLKTTLCRKQAENKEEFIELLEQFDD